MTENERRRPLRRSDRPDAPRARQKQEAEKQPDQQDRQRERPPRRRDQSAPPPPAPPAPTVTAFTPAAVAEVERFAATQPYPLDPFQIEAARHLAEGRSVLVAAPTGTGKTVVAEMGIWRARNAGQRAIYTAPLKALSNQKFRDLGAIYGADQVGLLTGDIVTNPRAPIVVMTTEIYRNMLLEGSRAARAAPPSAEADALLAGIRTRTEAAEENETLPGDELVAADDVAELARRAALDEELSSVGCVIFDELHYLSDPGRGPVWEEAIIHSPAHVRFIGLSATVSNADELRRWIEHVHGPIALVFHTERAVPLEHYYYLDGTLHLARDASGQRVERFPDIGGEAKLARLRNRMRRYESYYDDDEEDEEPEPPARVRIYTSGEPSPGRPAARQQAERPEQPEAPTEKEPKERKAPEAG